MKCILVRHHYARMAMLFSVLMLLALCGRAQLSTLKETITLQLKNTTALTVVQGLEKQSKYSFSYPAAELKKLEVSEFSCENMPLGDALKKLGELVKLEFKVSATNISIQTALPAGANGDMPVTRRITGTVTDSKTGNPLAGADISIQGQRVSAITNDKGVFTLDIKKPEATLVISVIGYATRFIPVTAADNMSVKMEADAKSLGGVTVGARRRLNTEVALLIERKNAAIVSDGISAQQMERTASITTTQALQRVSGVTITDDKYVAIRGLGDRSVIGQMNGIRLASSDPDRSAIPLDLIPASLLDNITVYKSMSPDKPADAAAGIIELKTKSIPDRQTLNITIQTGTNTQLGNGVNSFYNSDMGFFGQKVKDKRLSSEFKQLSTQYSNGLGEVQQKIANSRNDPALLTEVNRINGIMHQFDPVLTTKYKSAPANQVYSLTYGNNFTVFKKHRLGLILGGNYYSRSNDIYGGDLTQWSIYQGALTGNPDIYNRRVIPNYVTPNTINLGQYLRYKENTGTQVLNYGGLAGLAYRFNPRHEISFQYLGSQGAETKATNLYGQYEYTALPGGIANLVYSLKQTYRTLNTYNLQGEHRFLEGAYSPQLSYNLAASTSNQDDPDFRFANLADYMPVAGGSYIKPDVNSPGGILRQPTDHLYSLVSGYVNGYGPYGIIQADPNGRRFRKLNEDNYNYKADLTLPFKFFNRRQEFKTGVNYLFRKRRFDENVLYLPGSNFSSTGALALYEVEGRLDELVGYNRIGIHLPSEYSGEGQPRVGGYLYNTQKSPNNYKGYYETNAFYGMLDMRVTEQLRLTGGVRFEMTNVRSVVDTSNVFLASSITTVDGSGNKVNLVYTEPNSIYKTGYKPFYSANLTYTLNKNMNFRLGYNNSLARPELRELTNVFDFDPFQFALVVGNPKLVNQTTTNYDFRWEWFPQPGEVFAASAFYKQIDNQLTKVFKLNTKGLDAQFPEFPAVEFQNDPNRGYVYGIELEVVKNLGLLWDPLANFFIGSNLLLAQSDIKKTPERLESSRAIDRKAPTNSPLFEQAPYSVNLYLNYTNRKKGTDVTATFNMVGERLIQVNLDGTPDLYTRPMPVLDIVFTQQLLKRLQLKGFAKNILDRPYEEVYANPGSGGKFYGTKYLRRGYKRGAELAIGLSYTL